MECAEPYQQHGDDLQPHLEGTKSAECFPHDYRLYVHATTDAYLDSSIGWFVHFYEYHAEECRGVHPVGTYRKILGSPHSFLTDLVHVYRPLHLYAQHKSEVQTCIDSGHLSRFGLPILPIHLHRRTVVGGSLQCYLW